MRFGIDGVVEVNDRVVGRSRGDKGGMEGIVEEGFVGRGGVGIVVEVVLSVEWEWVVFEDDGDI